MLAGLGQAVVLRNMRCDVHLAQRRNVIAGIVGLVLADRDSSSRSFGFLLEHRLRGTPLGDAAGLCDGAVNSKTVAVLHDRMTHIAAALATFFSKLLGHPKPLVCPNKGPPMKAL